MLEGRVKRQFKSFSFSRSGMFEWTRLNIGREERKPVTNQEKPSRGYSTSELQDKFRPRISVGDDYRARCAVRSKTVLLSVGHGGNAAM